MKLHRDEAVLLAAAAAAAVLLINGSCSLG